MNLWKELLSAFLVGAALTLAVACFWKACAVAFAPETVSPTRPPTIENHPVSR